MNLKGKKFISSFSGGKDSTLALYRSIELGMIPTCLITTYNEDANRSWFHGITNEFLNMVSESVNIPLKIVPTSTKNYREKFLEELKQEASLGAEVCVFGDIDIEGHLEWCSALCKEAGLIPFFPLWKESRESLVKEFISDGFTATITVVDNTRLPSSFLGKKLTYKLMEEIKEAGADVCGENGEYHSFVTDGPLFRYPIKFKLGEILTINQTSVIPILKLE